MILVKSLRDIQNQIHVPNSIGNKDNGDYFF